jgi:hypothetical protein
MIAFLACAASIASVQANSLDRQGAISYTGPAERIVNLFPRLSTLLDVHLEASGSLGNEVLVISVKDASPLALTEKIAEVTHGKWVKATGSWVLTRDDRALATQERLNILEHLRKAIGEGSVGLEVPYGPAELATAMAEKHRMETDGSGESDEQSTSAKERLAQRLSVATPSTRALMRCLKDVDLTKFAGLRPDERLVYSSVPNGWQLSLGSHTREALRTLHAEQVAWASALKVGLGDEGSSEDSVSGRPPGRLLLSVEDAWGGSFGAKLKVLDSKGELSFHKEFDFGWFYGHDDAVAPRFVKTHPLEPSKALQDFSDALSVGSGRAPVESNVNFGSAVPFFAAAEINDPLELVPGELLRQAADRQGLNLVADLPDSAWDWTLNSTDWAGGVEKRPVITDQSLLDRLDDGVRFKIHDGWLTATPASPYESIVRRADRSAISRIGQRLLAHRHVTIDEWLEATGRFGEAPDYSPFHTFFNNWPSGNVPGGTGNPPSERLYGLLTASQRKTLQDGSFVTYAQLTGPQRAALGRLLFGVEYWNASESSELRQPFFDMTDELPAGLPANGRLSATRRRRRILEFIDPAAAQEPYYWSLNLDDGDQVVLYSGPGPRLPQKGVENTLFEVHNQNSLKFEWDCSPGHRRYVEFLEGLEPAAGPRLPFDKLPEEWKPIVKKQLDVLRDIGRRNKGGSTPQLPLLRRPLQQ